MRAKQKYQNKIMYSEQESICPPLSLSTINISLNSNPEALWEILYLRKRILEHLINDWHFILPEGNYVTEESLDVHIMISPRGRDAFRKIENISREELIPIGNLLLKFLDSSESEGVCGYNIGTDYSRSTASSWDNFHIHIVNREKLAYTEVQNIQELPEKLREPESQHICELSKKLLASIKVAGIETIIPPFDGPFNGFPISGAIAKLKPDITGVELIILLKDIHTKYKMLHRQILELFVDNYDEALHSHGVISFRIRKEQEIYNNLAILNSNLNSDGQLTKTTIIPYLHGLHYLINDNRFPWSLMNWNEHLNQKNVTRKFVNSNNKLITPPSYSIALAQREGNNYIVFAPHLLRTAGCHEVIGTLTNRTHREGISLEQRKQRGLYLIDMLKQ